MQPDGGTWRLGRNTECRNWGQGERTKPTTRSAKRGWDTSETASWTTAETGAGRGTPDSQATPTSTTKITSVPRIGLDAWNNLVQLLESITHTSTHPNTVSFRLSKKREGVFCHIERNHLNCRKRNFLGGPVVKNSPFNAGDTCSILGWGTKIPHATGQLSPSATIEESLQAMMKTQHCQK